MRWGLLMDDIRMTRDLLDQGTLTTTTFGDCNEEVNSSG